MSITPIPWMTLPDINGRDEFEIKNKDMATPWIAV